VIELPIPVEDGAKLIMSAGLIQPGDPRLKLAAAPAGEASETSAKNAA
jgi:uncharacterized membrane protein